jgi:hypothetical protein
MSARAVSRLVLSAAIAAAFVSGVLVAQSGGGRQPPGWSDDAPSIASLVSVARAESDLRGAVDRYLLDKAAIERRYEIPFSPVRLTRLRAFHQGWQRRLAEADFNALNPEGKIDYVMLRHRLKYDLEMLALGEQRRAEMAPLLPFFDRLRVLPEDRADRKRAARPAHRSAAHAGLPDVVAVLSGARPMMAALLRS